MTSSVPAQAFLSYRDEDEGQVEQIARLLQKDPHITFWFSPWHSIPSEARQTQLEAALQGSSCCIVFIGSAPGGIRGRHNEQMRQLFRPESRTILIIEYCRYFCLKLHLRTPTDCPHCYGVTTRHLLHVRLHLRRCPAHEVGHKQCERLLHLHSYRRAHPRPPHREHLDVIMTLAHGLKGTMHLDFFFAICNLLSYVSLFTNSALALV
jgi:hypothetical protein